MKLANEVTIYMGATLLERAVPFILLPLLTRVLSPSDYGMIAIFTVFVSVYSLVIGMGLSGFVRVIYQKSEFTEFLGYIGNANLLVLLSATVILLFSKLFESELTQYLTLDVYWVYIAFLLGCMQYIISARLNIYQAARQAVNYGKLQIIKPVLDLLLVLLLVVYLSGGGEDRLLAMVLSISTMGCLSLFLLYRDRMLLISFHKPFVNRALSFSLPLLPHSIATIAVFSFDRMIISSGLGLEILGVLAITVTIASPSLIVADTINRAFMPWSFEKFRLGKNITVVAVSYLLLFLMMLFCFVYSLLLWFGYDWFIGEEYQAGRMAAVVMTWMGFFKLVYYLVTKGLVFSEIVKGLPVISISIGALYLFSLYFFIESLNLLWLAYMMLAYHFSVASCTFIYSQIVFPQPWSKVAESIELSVGLLKEGARLVVSQVKTFVRLF